MGRFPCLFGFLGYALGVKHVSDWRHVFTQMRRTAEGQKSSGARRVHRTAGNRRCRSHQEGEDEALEPPDDAFGFQQSLHRGRCGCRTNFDDIFRTPPRRGGSVVIIVSGSQERGVMIHRV